MNRKKSEHLGLLLKLNGQVILSSTNINDLFKDKAYEELMIACYEAFHALRSIIFLNQIKIMSFVTKFFLI